MTVVPVVLERALLAGLLGFPAAGLLLVTAGEGEAGRVASAILVAAGLVYVVVTALVLRRSLPALAGAARPAPPDAAVEPLWRTALRAALKALAGVALGLAATAVGFGAHAVTVAIGFSLVTALGALQLHRLERAAGHRLVRVPEEPGALRSF